jgi:hypothetical protein
MGQQAGPARAAGRLAPPGVGTTGRIVLGPRKVRVVTRSGVARQSRGIADPPSVDVELGAGERLVSFSIEKSLGAMLGAGADRKTIDWHWMAHIETEPPKKKVKSRRRSTGNGSHRGRKAGS